MQNAKRPFILICKLQFYDWLCKIEKPDHRQIRLGENGAVASAGKILGVTYQERLSAVSRWSAPFFAASLQ
jgi:hypothetical protein